MGNFAERYNKKISDNYHETTKNLQRLQVLYQGNEGM